MANKNSEPSACGQSTPARLPYCPEQLAPSPPGQEKSALSPPGQKKSAPSVLGPEEPASSPIGLEEPASSPPGQKKSTPSVPGLEEPVSSPIGLEEPAPFPPGQKEPVLQNEFVLRPVGQVKTSGSPALLQITPAFAPALLGLEEYSHVQVLWWFDGTDTPQNCARTLVRCPYVGAPEKLGVFATRSPFRPNPIALSCARILSIDQENGQVALDAFDAEPGSFVLDLKPYAPSSDRVQSPSVPAWSAHWPASLEASESFDWERETVPDFHQ
ncbi:MAG: TrmO family methyltransferase [Oscillospiraceae bacterium]|nr:TrmO family methyltransferase [Oscillospiraceae bacterium]